MTGHRGRHCHGDTGQQVDLERQTLSVTARQRYFLGIDFRRRNDAPRASRVHGPTYHRTPTRDYPVYFRAVYDETAPACSTRLVALPETVRSLPAPPFTFRLHRVSDHHEEGIVLMMSLIEIMTVYLPSCNSVLPILGSRQLRRRCCRSFNGGVPKKAKGERRLEDVNGAASASV